MLGSRRMRRLLRRGAAAALAAACDLSPIDSPSLVVLPTAATAVIGEQLQLRTAWRHADGSPLSPPAGSAPVEWRTSRPDVAAVDDSGVVLGVAGGVATIMAQSGDAAGAALISVVPGTDEILVGAGDIAACASSGDEATAALLDGIPGIVFTAGDNVYTTGDTQADFVGCYAPSWGQYRARTRPAIGHMEYSALGSSNYWTYFGAAAGDSGKGYYSYDLGGWHVVVLNSKVSMDAGSPQEAWLRADLATSPKTCTLAIWHLPLYGSAGSGIRGVEGAWRALYDAGAEVVVNAHYEVYERFALQTPDGTLDPLTGIREFIVGTGGIGLNIIPDLLPNSEAISSGTFGVLKLTLGPASYRWQFVPVPGKTFTDAGVAPCHGRPAAGAPVASVTLAPSAATVAVGRTVQLVATPRDATGKPVTGLPPAAWSASDTTVAKVTASGSVVGWSPGSAVVRATIQGHVASATITVDPAPFAILVGAGDIGDCGRPGKEGTAALLDFIPGAVFTLGDNAYPDGSASDYANCYEPSWGRHKARTRPAPGNHDYETQDAAGYFGYYGAAAGEPGKGYYTYTVRGWRVIVLNNYIADNPDSQQVRWLDSTLAANSEACTLAMWHEPRFSSSTGHGSQPRTAAFWNTLYRHGADVVLVAHDHGYERFAPQDTTGTLDTRNGMREFVVGTGGASFYDFAAPLANSEVRDNGSWGVLKLELSPDSYAWAFVPVRGGTFTDSGSGACH